MGLLFCVAIGYAAAAVAPLVHRVHERSTGWTAAAVSAAVTAYLLAQVPHIANASGESNGFPGGLRASYAWVPDVPLSLHLDGLSLLFALLIGGIATVIFLYSIAYMRDEDRGGAFFAYMLLFMASMLGLVLADNAITLYVFFELTSLSSFLLIGLETNDAEHRRAAKQALIATNLGGLALLAGMLLAGSAAGTFTISEMLLRGDLVRAAPVYPAAVVLIALAAFTKSAQVPFHVWLPNAMVAPTPVSAFLHSAAMVKAGIYVLARFSPVLGGSALWTALLAGFGGLTMVAAGWLALRERDLKRVLAYATIMALGMMVLLLGIGTEEAVKACLVYVVAHACYKAALFMAAGAIDHQTGDRMLGRVRGLGRQMPVIFAAAVLAGLSMAGILPFLGAVGKEMIYKSLLEAGPVASRLSTALLGAAVLGNVALVAAAGLVGLAPFVGSSSHPHASRPGLLMSLAPGALGLAGLAFGLAPGLIDGTVIGPALSASLGRETSVHLQTWHGVTPELGLSAATLAFGIGLYFLVGRVRSSRPLHALDEALGMGPDRLYERLQVLLARGADALTSGLQSGVLARYLLVVFGSAGLLAGLALWTRAEGFRPAGFAGTRPYEWLLAGIIFAAACAAARSHSRLSAVLLLSTVSYGIGLFYLLLGAPDLAMTQLLVETLLAVFIVLAFVDLPELQRVSSTRRIWRDVIVAAFSGVIATLAMLSILQLPFESETSQYFAANSYVLAHGRNIVNTILVDFRALDTLGEITVLGVAGLSAIALLRRERGMKVGPPDVDDPDRSGEDAS